MIPTMLLLGQWRSVKPHIFPDAYVTQYHLESLKNDRLNASPEKGVAVKVTT